MNKTLLVLVTILVIGSSLLYINLSHYLNSPNSQDHSINVIIPKGYSVKKISKELAKKEVIKYPNLFWVMHKIFFSELSLQAGEYEILPHSSVRNILDMMHEGRVVIHKVTFPEGITVKEILDKVQSENLLFGEITKEFHEGDFLANTYHYTYGETKMMFLNRIYNDSQATIDNLWEGRDANLPLSSSREAVILASIIEKETGVANERPKIAAVFINRLRKKMRLQADPTVIYAITTGKYVFNRSITKSDLKIKSLYNTYLYSGLPPTAIASPGKEALYAALHPENTKAIYFVVDGKGGHNFSENLDQHNMHVNNYRKKGKDQNVK